MAEPRSLDQISDEELSSLGLNDVERARRVIDSFAGQGVTDDFVSRIIPGLFDALQNSPDPDRALNNFERWTNSVTNRYTHFQLLLHHPAALNIFFNVCGTSQLFSDILVHHPEYFEILANPGVRGGARTAGALYRDLSSFIDAIVLPELKLEAMRRFKRQEYLRIGVRDILGLTDLPGTVREFSNLADACIQKCLEIGLAQAEDRTGTEYQGSFAVIAMGKLGGRELNYSSDIDLMFVYSEPWHSEGNGPILATKLAESLVSALSSDLENGHLFRVDMRLRPEGRFGALARTLDSYRTYYESWGEPWEMQALLKARFVAGDTKLGLAFMKMIEPYVYRRGLTSEFVSSIRRNKEQIERRSEAEGISKINVKTGFGGIRDIEFTVQLLQLEMGGPNPRVRTSNTLEALYRLNLAGAIPRQAADELSDDYQFLRNVEHRLQILYGLQTQTMPVDARERELLARRLGFKKLSAFDEDYSRRTQRVHEYCVRLFYEEWRKDGLPAHESFAESLADPDSPSAHEFISTHMRDLGYKDPERAYQTIKSALIGTNYGAARPESRSNFQSLAPRLIHLAAGTGDPDSVLNAIQSLALATPNRAAIYKALFDSSELLERFVILAAGGPPMVQILSRHLEWLDLLVSEEVIDPEVKTAERYASELKTRLATRKSISDEQFWQVLANYMLRERLRIAARDLWGEIRALSVARELTSLADAIISSILDYSVKTTLDKFKESEETLSSVAIIGLGKLGGRELGYGSDWDILLVYDDQFNHAPKRKALRMSPGPAINALAESVLGAGQKLRVFDLPVELDARLRPEGRFGILARTVDDYRRYYVLEAETWERQVLIKARPIAGNMNTANAYIRSVNELLYAEPLSVERQRQVQDMKRRIEAERLDADKRHSDLKLGQGGLSDIEFAVQLWQMRIGYDNPEVRVTSTVQALYALGAAGAIPGPDAARLADAYSLGIAARNRISLYGGLASNTLPEDRTRLRSLAIGLGVLDSASVQAEDALKALILETMKETREVIERLFYYPIH